MALIPTFAYDCRRLGAGSQRCRMGHGIGDAELESFNSDDSTPQCSVAAIADARMNDRFGRATFPEVTGSAPDRPAGLKLGAGVSMWALARRLEGRAFWIAQSWISPYENTPYTGAGGKAFPAFQDVHTPTATKFGSVRVRSHATTGQIQTAIVENDGADGISINTVTHTAAWIDTTLGVEYGPDVGLHDGNVVDVMIQGTPLDPLRVAEAGVTHKHNLSVWVRSRDPDGNVFFAPAIFTHYAPTDAAGDAWNTRIEEPFHMGRTIGQNGTDGYRGDLLAMAIGAMDDSAWLTDVSAIADAMDDMWDRLVFGGAARNRSRSRARR